MRTVILGATKGIGRSIARELVERGGRVFLLGRDAGELEKCAADLETRSPHLIKVEFTHCDLESPEGFEPALDAADEALEGFDAVVVTAAIYATAEKIEEDSDYARDVATINFTNTVLFCEAARVRLLARETGTLCVLSSVAGDRARKSTSVYGASKAGLSHYLDYLDLRYRKQGLKTVAVRPGFIKTAMTEGLKPPPFAGLPDPVARRVVRAMEKGRPLIYAPAIWRLVMLLIRHLPRFVMRRSSF